MFFQIGTKCGKNKKQGPKYKSGQNVEIKSAFTPNNNNNNNNNNNKIIIIIIIIVVVVVVVVVVE